MDHDILPFSWIGAAGFYLALDIDFLRPLREVVALPEGWMQEYRRHGMMADDPALRWAQVNVGYRRWSDMQDSNEVLLRASDWGLCFGASLAVTSRDGMRRSYVLLARSDREISDTEMEEAMTLLTSLHDVQPPTPLTKAELEVLGALQRGSRLKKIAFDLGVSESAIKQRLRNARAKLGAETATQASTLAHERGLI